MNYYKFKQRQSRFYQLKINRHSYFNTILVSVSFILSVLLDSCNKMVAIDPSKTQLETSSVFGSGATAISAITGVYESMSENIASCFNGGITLDAGLAADELRNYQLNNYGEFYLNNITPSNLEVKNNLWGNIYKYIYQANSILEGLVTTKNVTPAVKQQLTGEAKFTRAFCYFYLVNMFDSVPLITSTNYQTNALASRTSKVKVYQQMVADLKDAQTLLNNNYVKADNTAYISAPERVRPNKSVATALLARIDLYQGDWVNAEALASAVISNTGLYNIVTDLNQVFNKNSNETIWQLMPVAANLNTGEGYIFTVRSGIPIYGSLTNQLVNAFEPGDLRKTNWITSYVDGGQTYYMPYKYKIGIASSLIEYYTVLRLSEQYLIRAEARAYQNNLTGAIDDINAIRSRAGLPNLLSTLTQPQILTALEKENRIEFFAEWGHRWFDLKRNNRADAVLSPIKGTNWSSTDVLFPIPVSEIANDPNLTQNPG